MIGIIVCGHGEFASGITSSLNLIMGEQEGYIPIDFPFGSSITELEDKFNKALSEMVDYDNIIILADLFGGSPFNVSMKKAINNANIQLYYGLNLGMLIELVSKRNFNDDISYVTEEIITIGKQQIGKFEPSSLSEVSYEESSDEL